MVLMAKIKAKCPTCGFNVPVDIEGDDCPYCSATTTKADDPKIEAKE